MVAANHYYLNGNGHKMQPSSPGGAMSLSGYDNPVLVDELDVSNGRLGNGYLSTPVNSQCRQMSSTAVLFLFSLSNPLYTP